MRPFEQALQRATPAPTRADAPAPAAPGARALQPPSPALLGLAIEVWAVVAALTLARLALVVSGAFNLAPDEAYFWEWARHPAFGYYDQGPVVAWMIAVFLRVFGATELGVRAGALLGGAATLLLLAGFTRRLGGSRRAALLATLAGSVTPLGNANGFIMTYYVPQLLLWMLCLHSLLDIEARGRPADWLRLGLWVGLGGLTHHTFLWLALLCLVWILWQPRARRAMTTPWPYAAALLSAALVAPYVAWNATHDWVGPRHAMGLMHTGRHGWGDVGVYVLGQLAVLSPVYCVTAWMAAWGASRGAFAAAASAARDRSRLFAITVWPLFAYVAVLAWSGRAEANWTSAATLPLAAAWALGMDRAWARAGRMPLRVAVGLGVALALTVALHDVSLLWQAGVRFKDPSHDPTHRLHGWRELGRAAYDERIRLGAQGPTVTATVDDYAIPSELTFYAPDHAPTYCPPVGRRHHQYDFWPMAAPPPGGNAVWVTRHPIEPAAPERALFRTWGAPRRLDIVEPRSGVIRRSFYLYDCRGFTGPPRDRTAGY